MVFTNRWVCKTVEDFDIERVRRTLQNYYATETGEEYELVSMIELEPEIVAADRTTSLNGKLYFQREVGYSDFNITASREIHQIPHIQRITESIDFWFSSNPGLFLFRHKDDTVIHGREILSEIIFEDSGKIKSLEFNIEQIENSINNGTLQGMWTFSYKNRQGNIHSGNAYGNDVNQDPMYSQTIGAPRNFIGVECSIGNEIAKVAIYRGGSITIFSDLEDPAQLLDLFNIIEGFEQYAQIID
ncbi:hypothetical protein [Methanoregula sp. UBA64]|jgi:hypothetical protein|uniref:hypothetical protein n=1 Tax=Methanoregula sp. UBA64 TaxID=1915554 RepID=UPI0025D0D632|nr:hypothetical protein [Methanoregula sp. UBA64]